jgi:DNA polymerase III epsilon subunit-like protein
MKELFIDFETTGLPQNGSFERVGVTQFSCIYRENGAVQRELDLHCRPFEGALISKEALHVTGKTIADLEAAPPEEEQFEVFRKRIVSLREEIDSVEKSVVDAIDLYESLMPDVNVAINSLQSFIDSEE